MRRRVVGVALVVLLVTSLPAAVATQHVATQHRVVDVTDGSQTTASDDAPVVDAGSTAPESIATGVQDDGVLERTLTLHHRPESADLFGVELTMTVPSRVSSLTLTLESDATVESASGFERTDAGVYEWTGATDRPSLTFAMPDDWHDRDHRGTTEGSDERFFADAGEWGIVPVPRVGLDWTRPSSSDPVTVERNVVVDGPGATGGDVAFFGAVEDEYVREVRGERIRLVVPEAADPRESPAAVVDALANASDDLRIDGRNDEVFVVAAPTDGVEWGARGVQYGDADAWVAADARLETASSPWLHEYVHTRQAFADGTIGTTAETRWLVEGQAVYHAALLALEANRIDYRQFEEHLADGRQPPAGDDVLAEPTTWNDPRADYVKGSLVLAALDRRIRLETDGERTLAHVVRRLNLRDEPVTGAAFLDVVAAVAGPDAREFAARHAETADVPETWDREAHRAAFGQEIAVFEYGIDDDVAVTGPYRDAPLEAVEAVVVGETLEVPIRIANVGERAGEYYAPVVVDGRVVRAESGTLEAGSRVAERLEWTPDESGRYDVRVGDDTVSVRVRSPAEAAITDIEADADRVAPNDPVTVRATVENDAGIPAERTVTIRTPSGVAHETMARLGPSESTTVEATVRFEEPGRYEIAVGDRTTTVTVERDTDGRTENVLEEVPGFDGPATIAALAAAVVLTAAGRTRRPG